MRASAAFIAICMIVIAGSAGASAYLLFGLGAIEAAAVGAASLSLLAAYNAFAGRAQERNEAARQVAELSRGTTDLARQVGELGRRVIAVEAAIAHANEQARNAARPLVGEIDTLGGLVASLAQSVAAHDAALANHGDANTVVASAEREPDFAEEFAEPAAASAERTAAPRPEPPLSHDPMERTAAETPPIDPTLIEDRIDLYLQPIFTLPQRKVRHYEALPRLRDEDEEPLGSFRPLTADDIAIAPRLDSVMLRRAVEIVHRLTGKNREVALFYRLSGRTLGDSALFSEVFELLSEHTLVGPSMFLGIAQSDLRACRAREEDAMARLVGLGFRFSLEQATDLRLEPRQLAALGFRFVKAPAATLLARTDAPAADIHAADFASLLARYGIDLIAGEIETEGMVVDLLDYNVPLAQGPLFSTPRPVRPDVFRAQPRIEASARPRSEAVFASDMPRPAERRRESDPPPSAPTRAGAERQGLAKLARNIMRRA